MQPDWNAVTKWLTDHASLTPVGSLIVSVGSLAVSIGSLAVALHTKYSQRTVLHFVLSSNREENVPEESADGDIDGMLFAYALGVAITNDGPKPVTIRAVVADYRVNLNGKERKFQRSDYTTKKLGQGESHTWLPHWHGHNNLVIIETIVAVDTTGRKWPVGRKVIQEFNDARIELDRKAIKRDNPA